MLTMLMAVWTLAAFDGGWENTRWGMTPQEVQTAMPQTRLQGGSPWNGLRQRAEGRFEFAGVRTEARYYFGEQGLEAVSLEAPFRRCRDVATAIIEAHGTPVKVSDQVILRLDIWHDEPTETRIRLLTSAAGICTLYFERLDRYRDVDLQAVQQP